MKPTNARVLADALNNYDILDWEEKETIADYIECPSARDCTWDGNPKNQSVCTECKVRWLEQEWEG
jgi:hypothetical protein